MAFCKHCRRLRALVLVEVEALDVEAWEVEACEEQACEVLGSPDINAEAMLMQLIILMETKL